MDNIRNSLLVLFRDSDPISLISKDVLPIEDQIETATSDFSNIYELLNDGHTCDEIILIKKLLNNEWILDSSVNKSIFSVILKFTKDVLVENKEKIVCCHLKDLLRWREITQHLGENIFICAFLAKIDDRLRRTTYQEFDWSPIISSDDDNLKNIFERGLAELHSHLKGSSFNYDLSWLSLMNDVAKRNKNFDKVKKKRFADSIVSESSTSTPMHQLVIYASAIRLLLFHTIMLHDSENDLVTDTEEISALIQTIVKIKCYKELQTKVQKIQLEISKIKSLNHLPDHGCVKIDYALIGLLKSFSEDIDSLAKISLCGERWLIYNIFKLIFKDKDLDPNIANLFHVYIIIKSRFRKEMIQVNNRYGFANFSKYEDRKTIFIPTDSIHYKLLINMAINETMRFQKVKYIEARIAPEINESDLRTEIEKLDELIFDCKDIFVKKNGFEEKEDRLYQHYYIIHFIKSNKEIACEGVMCRDETLRDKVKQQSEAIYNLKKGGCLTSKRIIGIDAASSEMYSRPEVFAQAYRYLKILETIDSDKYNDEKVNPLKFTFHAGEDFVDIVDGMRAIEETVRLLNFSCGDRIGHALALGIDPQSYYDLKCWKIVLKKQDLLDNTIWIQDHLKKYNINISTALNDFFDTNIKIYLKEIYIQNTVDDNHVENYLSSYYLRGDAPSLYKDKPYKEILQNKNHFSQDKDHFVWADFSFSNNKEDIKLKKLTEEACELYYQYHYNQQVKEKGDQIVEIEIPKIIIEPIKKLQLAMQKDLMKKQIGIECNPSSNKVIGTFRRYDKHPIFNFFNKGLKSKYDRQRKLSQMTVSINTDDQGVFDTLLENEYALMAIALKKELSKNGKNNYDEDQIYNWLEDIRQMGFQQGFHKESLASFIGARPSKKRYSCFMKFIKGLILYLRRCFRKIRNNLYKQRSGTIE